MDGKVTRVLLTATEVGMLLYWVFASGVALGLLQVSPGWMYSDYTNPIVVSWNWSFLPLDIMFAVTGLLGRYAQLDDYTSDMLSTISISLMFCAGLMAISFWAIAGFFDPFWWGINLWLALLPIFVASRRYLQRGTTSGI